MTRALLEHEPSPPGGAVRTVVALAWPAVATLYLQSFYANNDAFWCGRLGTEVAGALGLFMLVLFLNIAVTMLVNKGAQSLIAQAWGRGDGEEASLVARQALILALIVGVITGVLGFIGARPLLELLGGAEGTVEQGVRYLRLLYLGAPFMLLTPTVEALFQGSGDTKSPMKLMGVEIVVNVSLSPLFAFGLDMGIAGLALATVTSWIAAFALGARWLLAGRAGLDVAPGGGRYRVIPKRLRTLLQIGLPTAVSTAGYCLIYAAVVRLVIAPFGDTALGAFGIGVRGVEGLAYRFFLGVSIATATLVGREVGAGCLDRARRMTMAALLVGAVPAVLFSLLFVLFPAAFARIYTNEPEVVATTAAYVFTLGTVQIFGMVEAVLEGAFIGRGRTLPLLLVAIPGNLLRVPLAYIFAFHLDWGLDGVWRAVALSMVVKAVALWLVFRRSRMFRAES